MRRAKWTLLPRNRCAVPEHEPRPPTVAAAAMVTSPHALASQAGVDVLRCGGSAIDAAIAASAVLGVVYPHMTSIGGDAFWLIYDAASDRVRYLDGAGMACASGTIDAFRRRGLREVPLRGALPATLTVPGAVASWCAAHDEYGRLTRQAVLEPAIALADEGFPASERLVGWMPPVVDEGALNAAARAVFLPDGHIPRAGQRIVNRELARSLEHIARDGWHGFYDGEVAAALLAYAGRNAGFFAAADLARQQARWGESIVGTYRGITIHQTPPPTQGFCVLQMLKLLEGFDVRAWPFLGVDHVHHLVQAKQLSYHDRDRWLADSDYVDVPVARLVSDAYADERRALIIPGQALAWDEVPSYGSLAGDTVFVSVVDGDGNAVSLIQSVYGVFGSGEVVPGTGIVLQNRSAYFSLDPSHANALAPGKKPLHTLIASLAFNNGRLWQTLGCMGADGQPQIQVQAYVALIDYRLNIQQALDMPRWLSGRFAIGEPRDLLNIEAGFPAETLQGLAQRGHKLNRWAARNELAGHAHGITIDPTSGARHGGADPRSDGVALGF